MSEPFLQSVARVICAFRVHLSETEFLLVRYIEVELGVEGALAVEFEDDDDENRRNSRDPVERIKAVLQTNGWEGREYRHRVE